MFKLFGVILSLCLAALLGAGFYFIYEVAAPLSLSNEQRQFTINAGQSVKQVSRVLTDRGIIRNDYWFRVYVWLRGAESRFLAGTYNFPAQLSSIDLLNLFLKAAERPTRRIQILEGWSINDIDAYLAKAGWYPAGDYKKAAGDSEGYLFPDTYELFTDAAVEDLVAKQKANFEAKVVPAMLTEISRQGKSLKDIIIMASIIEAEVPHEADRPVVSDIFWSRLKAGVALQSDATLHYMIGGKNPSLTAAELKIDSPYNTYKHRGLPPGPIGNPGLSAIKAAIYPAQTGYFYFLSTPAGETVFSRTLGEHNAAKAKYLR